MINPTPPSPVTNLTVLDLPQLHTRPSSATLLSTLSLLTQQPRTFRPRASRSHHAPPPRPSLQEQKCKIDETGVPGYLTRIVSSSLAWIEAEEERDAVWAAAAARLAERAGRTALGGVLERVVCVPIPSEKKGGGEEEEEGETVDIKLREPGLTGDNLGHKTWCASYVLACLLPRLLGRYVLPPSTGGEIGEGEVRGREKGLRVLELGAGTGLLGLACAGILRRRGRRGGRHQQQRGQGGPGPPSAHIHLTDLPAIVPNLRANVERNHVVVDNDGDDDGGGRTDGDAKLTVGELDWSLVPGVERVGSAAPGPGRPQQDDGGENERGSYDTILAADSIYADDHVEWLGNAIAYYLLHTHHHPRPPTLSVPNGDDGGSTDHSDLKRRGKAIICLPRRPHSNSTGDSSSKVPEAKAGEEEEEEAFHAHFRTAMQDRGLRVVEEGVETGWDDWGGQGQGQSRKGEEDDEDEEGGGNGEEEGEGKGEEEGEGRVRCWWSVWMWIPTPS